MTTVERLLELWTQPVPATPEAVAAFGEPFADPISVNRVELSVRDLVERARAAQRAFVELSLELLDEVHAPDRLVLVVLQRGRHVGPLVLPGKVGAVQVVPDQLGLAMQLGAVSLARIGAP